MRMVVDLPQPLGPRKPNTSARFTSRFSPSTAASWPKRLVRPRARITASPSFIARAFRMQRQAGRQRAAASPSSTSSARYTRRLASLPVRA